MKQRYLNLILTSSNKAFFPTRYVTLFALIMLKPLFSILYGCQSLLLLYINRLFFQGKKHAFWQTVSLNFRARNDKMKETRYYNPKNVINGDPLRTERKRI